MERNLPATRRSRLALQEGLLAPPENRDKPVLSPLRIVPLEGYLSPPTASASTPAQAGIGDGILREERIAADIASHHYRAAMARLSHDRALRRPTVTKGARLQLCLHERDGVIHQSDVTPDPTP